MSTGTPRDASATRGGHFAALVRSRGLVYAVIGGITLSLAAAAANHDPRVLLYGGGLVLLFAVGAAWYLAGADAADDFFSALAPELGLTYVRLGGLPELTPLLSAGARRTCEHVMLGPLFGDEGGPACTFAHYAYYDEDERTAHPFSVYAIEVEAALPIFHGVYLGRRTLLHMGAESSPWLARVHAEEVDLESADFERLYELRAARDQDRLALRELFSPSLIVWLSEHPLHPGFECKGGMMAVFVPGHEQTADHLRLLHEAARDITRRVLATAEGSGSVSPAA